MSTFSFCVSGNDDGEIICSFDQKLVTSITKMTQWYRNIFSGHVLCQSDLVNLKKFQIDLKRLKTKVYFDMNTKIFNIK